MQKHEIRTLIITEMPSHDLRTPQDTLQSLTVNNSVVIMKIVDFKLSSIWKSFLLLYTLHFYYDIWHLPSMNAFRTKYSCDGYHYVDLRLIIVELHYVVPYQESHILQASYDK